MVDLPFPSESDETTNPVSADEIYQSAVRWLLNHTRDKGKNKMIFDENVTYGFRRNAYGLKTIGIGICLSTSVWVLISEGIVKVGKGSSVYIDPSSFTIMAVLSLAMSAVMLLIWLSFFTEDTVRNAAFTYAEALLRACDKIG